MKHSIFILWLAIWSFGAIAKEVPKQPKPLRMVNDFAKVLSPEELQALEQRVRLYNDTTSSEVAIVTIASLEGDNIDDFSYRLASAWGVGKAGKDNGILILVALKERKMRVEVGRGLEGVITDAATYYIREDYLKPAFREQQYAQGFNQALDYMFGLATGEYTAEPVKKPVPFAAFGFIIVFVAIVLISRMVTQRRIRRTMREQGVDYITAMALLGISHRYNNRGGTSYWGGSGGFGGGSSGGGFGGFGGGSFGGGGSSGGW